MARREGWRVVRLYATFSSTRLHGKTEIPYFCGRYKLLDKT